MRVEFSMFARYDRSACPHFRPNWLAARLSGEEGTEKSGTADFLLLEPRNCGL